MSTAVYNWLKVDLLAVNHTVGILNCSKSFASFSPGAWFLHRS